MAASKTERDDSLYARREGVIVSTRAWLPDADGLAALEAAWRPATLPAAAAGCEGRDASPQR